MTLDPRSAALFAIIALVLVGFGVVVVIPGPETSQRAAAVASLFAALALVSWRARRRHGDDDNGS